MSTHFDSFEVLSSCFSIIIRPNEVSLSNVFLIKLYQNTQRINEWDFIESIIFLIIVFEIFFRKIILLPIPIKIR